MHEVKNARGLGLAEVLATRQLSTLLGTKNTTAVRAFGLHELGAIAYKPIR